MKHILVTGGAGYIGSHMVKLLIESGFLVTSFDNLSSGQKDSIHEGYLSIGDLRNINDLEKLFTSNKFDAILHFAGLISVGESIQNPSIYYDNNVTGSINLLKTMVKHNVKNIIFSSTAAVFGNPLTNSISENHPKSPINPYGKSKLIVEQILSDFHISHGIQYGILRYFNASGADKSGSLGESHFPETHLIPLAIFAAVSPKHYLSIFGNDYPTDDGTCIRDYIHISDLCEAHLLVLRELLANNNKSFEFNLGNGNGYSVMDIIHSVEKLSLKKVKYKFCPRRPGDPSKLIANSTAIKNSLGWQPKYSSLDEIIQHAITWELSKKRYII
jgi:UDP-glucose 4-epimerase